MMDRHILTPMRNPSSRILTVISRIMLLMFVFGLLSQAAQACTLAKTRVAMEAGADSNPCQISGKVADAYSRCSQGNQLHADACSIQSPAAVSSERFSPSPEPVALTVALLLVPPAKLLQTVGLDAPPPILPHRPVPLSILHCSFQI